MILVIAEKNAAARRIASILSGGNLRKSSIGGVQVYEFHLNGERAIAIGLRGHILDVDYPEEFREWSRIDPRELINTEPVVVEREPAIIRALRELGEKAKLAIVACDYDTEGENIGLEALRILREINDRIIVYRARFSSLTPREIREAFENLTLLDYNLAMASEARRYIDLVWGAVLTRILTLYSKVGRRVLSVGRVQTPTLKLVVDREREIASFVPREFYLIKALVGYQPNQIELQYPKRIFDREELSRIRKKLREEGVVRKIEKREIRVSPPHPLDTTTFLKECHDRLGLAPKRAMQIAEELYLMGLISYPRTDNTVYPPSLNLRGLVQMLSKISQYSDYCSKILVKDRIIPTRGRKETSDHPPIHPVDIPRGRLSEVHQSVYDLIARRFLATVGDKALLLEIRAEVDFGEIFVGSDRIVLYPGWIEIYEPDLAEKKDSKLLKLREGGRVRARFILKKDKTKPKPRFTQGVLVKLMESLNLGTKSTRQEIISKLFERGYITGRSLRATTLGITVIEALEKVAEIVTKPDLTAKLEKEMEEIAIGKRTFREVVEDARRELEKITAEIKPEDLEEIELGNEDVVGPCQECGGSMRLTSIRGRDVARCEKCGKLRFLPREGSLRLLKSLCPRCKTYRLISVRRRRKRSFKLCIKCGIVNDR